MSAPPNVLLRATSAKAAGATPRLARRGHSSQGANQMAMPRITAAVQTTPRAALLAPGAGNGSVTRPSAPEPAKNTPARRPESSCRRRGPSSANGPAVPPPLPAGEPSGRASGAGRRPITSACCSRARRVAEPAPEGSVATSPSPSRQDAFALAKCPPRFASQSTGPRQEKVRGSAGKGEEEGGRARLRRTGREAGRGEGRREAGGYGRKGGPWP